MINITLYEIIESISQISPELNSVCEVVLSPSKKGLLTRLREKDDDIEMPYKFKDGVFYMADLNKGKLKSFDVYTGGKSLSSCKKHYRFNLTGIHKRCYYVTDNTELDPDRREDAEDRENYFVGQLKIYKLKKGENILLENGDLELESNFYLKFFKNNQARLYVVTEPKNYNRVYDVKVDKIDAYFPVTKSIQDKLEFENLDWSM